MGKFIFTLLFLMVAFIVNGQLISFINVYGNTGYDYGRDVKEDNDSGFVITGSSSSFGSSNAEAFILKVDKNGNFLWSHNYGGTGSDWGQSILVTNDSSYALAGYSNSYSSGDFDFYLVRADTNGALFWEKNYGGSDWDRAFGLIQLDDSGFVMVGETFSFSDSKDGYVIRTNKTGDTIWTKVIGGIGEDFFRSVSLDGDSLVICGGSSSAGQGELDGYVVKLGLDGNIGWEKYLGQNTNDFFTSVSVFGGYYVFGGERSYDFDNFDMDTWIYKLSDDGLTTVVDTTYPSPSPARDGINSIQIHPLTQDIFWGGYTSSWGYVLDGQPDFFFGKLNSAGLYVTDENYGALGDDICFGLEICRDIGVIFVGDTRYFSTGGNNILLVKLSYLWQYPDQLTDMTFNNITNDILEAEKNKYNILVYPNPVNDFATINSTVEINNTQLFSIDGQLLKDFGNAETIKLDEFPTGIYLLKMTAGNQVYTSKIIKN